MIPNIDKLKKNYKFLLSKLLVFRQARHQLYVEITSQDEETEEIDEVWYCPEEGCTTKIKFKYIYNIKRHAYGHGGKNYYYRMCVHLL